MENEKTISAEKLVDVLRDDPYIDGQTFARVMQHINEAPDATKRGRWCVVPKDYAGRAVYCSCCGEHFILAKSVSLEALRKHHKHCNLCGSKNEEVVVC